MHQDEASAAWQQMMRVQHVQYQQTITDEVQQQEHGLKTFMYFLGYK